MGPTIQDQTESLSSWEQEAKAKRDSINALIPHAWRLLSVPSPTEQKDVTDGYVRQFLTGREVDITETDACGIVLRTATGEWKAREVAEAFCHRAALAHQLV